MSIGLLGAVATPAQGNRIEDAAYWAADNGCGPGVRGIAAGYPGDVPFLAWLASMRHMATRCAFAVAPDVVGDAAKTLRQFGQIAAVMRAMGYPVALAAQNGLEDMTVPWDSFDALFIGGDTTWKLGAAARSLTAQAKALGKHVHMGRVNSLRRLQYARAIGCDSADGTYLAFGPDANLPKLLGWLRDVNCQGALWEAS